MDKNRINELLESVEEQGIDSDKMLDKIITQYIEPLDKTINKIQTKAIEFNGNVPIDVLNSFILELQPIIFFTLTGLEKLGNRSDVAEQFRINKYNSVLQSSVGTAPVKAAYATSQSENEQFISNIYARAYKAIKNRCDSGQNLIDSLKKSLSAKMSEISLTKSQNYNNFQENNQGSRWQ